MIHLADALYRGIRGHASTDNKVLVFWHAWLNHK